jgi:methyl-accepting chemotaxis protein
MFRTTVGQRIAAGFALPIVILIAIGSISYRNTSSLIENSSWVTHSHAVLVRLERILAMTVDSETGPRGYVITGDERHLEPYRATIARIDPAIRELTKLTEDSAKQQQRRRALEPVLAARLKFSQDVIEVRKERGLEAAAELVRTDQGRTITEEVRRLVGEMQNEEHALLGARGEEARASARLTKASIGIGARKRLLVVDDSVTTRSLVRSILESAGYDVTVAADGEAAWQLLQGSRHPPAARRPCNACSRNCLQISRCPSCSFNTLVEGSRQALRAG